MDEENEITELPPEREPSKSLEEKVSELDEIDDVPLEISVVLGETSIALKDLLQMQQGSVIELNKLAGEPLDITLRNRHVAKGEVVVINDKYGIRMTDIVE